MLFEFRSRQKEHFLPSVPRMASKPLQENGHYQRLLMEGGRGGIILQENNFLSRDGLLAVFFFRERIIFEEITLHEFFSQRKPQFSKETLTL